MRLLINVPEVLIEPFMKIVLEYRRWKYGYPFRRIPLTEGKFAIIDPEDFNQINKLHWHLDTDCYASSSETIDSKRKKVYMHRKIMPAMPHLVIDHINQDKLDNRKINLRIATRAQNNLNKKSKPHSSRFKGVSFHKLSNKWMAQIKFSSKRIYLGLFTDEIQAAKTYDNAAKKYHGQFACLNFPK